MISNIDFEGRGIKCIKDVKNNTFWMTKEDIAILYGTGDRNIAGHIKNIFDEKELDKKRCSMIYAEMVKILGRKKGSLTSFFDYKGRPSFYNDDVVLSIGFRVSSNKGFIFRNKVREIIREYYTKGYVINKRRVENDRVARESLLEEVREIRLEEIESSKSFNDMVKSICSDYDTVSEKYLRNCFGNIQMITSIAATGKKPSQITIERADASKEYMGLTSFKGKSINRKDIGIGKNYYTKYELESSKILKEWFLGTLKYYIHFNKKDKFSNIMKKYKENLISHGIAFPKQSNKFSQAKAQAHAKNEFEKYKKLIKRNRIEDK